MDVLENQAVYFAVGVGNMTLPGTRGRGSMLVQLEGR
jgi:hypothetical protein